MPLITYSLTDLVASPFFSPHAHAVFQLPSSRISSGQFATLSQSIAYQLLSALGYLHALRPPIAHRDIKPANILITPSGCLKLIDFGTAWKNEPDQGDLWPEPMDNMCPHVCTGSYRAPETLFNPRSYDAFAVDMWSAGATLSELFTQLRFVPTYQDEDESDGGLTTGDNSPGAPQESHLIPQGVDIQCTPGLWERNTLFDARNGTLGLTWSIFQTLGSPREENWPSFRTLPDANKLTFADASPVGLWARLPSLPSPGGSQAGSRSHTGETDSSGVVSDSAPNALDNAPLDLLKSLLVLEPNWRLRAKEALNHSWFTSPEILLPQKFDGREDPSEILEALIGK